jgi:hypothetical protein
LRDNRSRKNKSPCLPAFTLAQQGLVLLATLGESCRMAPEGLEKHLKTAEKPQSRNQAVQNPVQHISQL